MDAIDNGIDKIVTPILKVIETIIGFILSSKVLTIIVYVAFITWLGYYIMKVDKKYAKEDKRRVPENTLLLISAVGGSIGMYIGMYKFKHKTLHKKFTIGVPLIMLIQLAYIVYLVISKIIIK